MRSSSKSDSLRTGHIFKKLHICGIGWAGCNSGNSLTRRFVLLTVILLNIFQKRYSGYAVVEIGSLFTFLTLLMGGGLNDLSGGSRWCSVKSYSMWAAPCFHAHLCCGKDESILPCEVSYQNGKCAAILYPAWSPQFLLISHIPDTGIRSSYYLGTSDTPQFSARLYLFEVKKTKRIF